jgi:hypothetical protein
MIIKLNKNLTFIYNGVEIGHIDYYPENNYAHIHFNLGKIKTAKLKANIIISTETWADGWNRKKYEVTKEITNVLPKRN